MSIYAERRFEARVGSLFAATGADGFVGVPAEVLELTWEGIAGDLHAGLTRRSGAREPWHARGSEMRNERQVSLACRDELAVVAERLGVPAIAPEWIGANIVLEGVPNLSRLPPRTILLFAGGASVKIDGQNAPCRQAGGAIAQRVPGVDARALELAFPKAAAGRRGLVGWVERPGTIRAAEAVTVLVPQQWIWEG